MAHAQLQWQFHTYDEFNGALHDNIDTTKWIPANVIPAYWKTAPDAVTYCSQGSTANTCSDTTANPYELDGLGHLVIHAVYTNTNRSVTTAEGSAPEPVYNSGRLESINDADHQFRYGRFEARVRVPKGQGAWPAFWLIGSNYNLALSNPGTMGWPATGEIDILEQWSVNSNASATDLNRLYQNQSSVHGPLGPTGSNLLNSQLDQGATSPNSKVELGDAFHTYAVDWLPGEVDYYIDGALFGRNSPALLSGTEVWELDAIDTVNGSQVPRTDYPILNLDVGTVHSGTDDCPVVTGAITTPTDLLMTVDYVRHYTFEMDSQSRTLPAFYGDADLGGGGSDSNATYSSGTFSITGTGYGTDMVAGSSSHMPNDQLHYVYRALSADGTYSVKVGSQNGALTDVAGGGLMIRDGRAAYAQFVSTWVAVDGTVHFQSRVSQTPRDATFGTCGPYLRIVKSGTSFTGACSTDGTTWTTTGTATVSFSNHELAGLVAFAGGNSIGPIFADVLNTVAFTNLSVPAGSGAWDGNAPDVPQPTYKTDVNGNPKYRPATLVQVENYDVGGQGIAYSTSGKNMGQQYRILEPISIYNTTDYTTTGSGGTNVSGFYVGDTHKGQWINYTINVTAANPHTITTRVASQGAGGTFHYTLDGTSVGGEMTVPDTGGWDTWSSLTTSSFNLAVGTHTLHLVMDTEGAAGAIANFDLFTISADPL